MWGDYRFCCFPETQLYQWSVKDITRSGSYQSRREGVYSSSQPVASLAGSALCLGSHDPSLATESKMSELLDLGVEDSQVELKWPVELLVTVSEDGELAVFNRSALYCTCSTTDNNNLMELVI